MNISRVWIVASAAAFTTGAQPAWAKDRDYGIGRTAPATRTITVAPVVITRTVVVGAPGSNMSRPVQQPRSAPLNLYAETHPPYLVGSGQWTPTPGWGVPSDSGWNWRRAELSELVELSRRNKALRAEAP
jgi:hypothetical protein